MDPVVLRGSNFSQELCLKERCGRPQNNRMFTVNALLQPIAALNLLTRFWIFYENVNQCSFGIRFGRYRLSQIIAMPCPPPIHAVASPYRPFRRRNSRSNVSTSRVPVAFPQSE